MHDCLIKKKKQFQTVKIGSTVERGKRRRRRRRVREIGEEGGGGKEREGDKEKRREGEIRQMDKRIKRTQPSCRRRM